MNYRILLALVFLGTPILAQADPVWPMPAIPKAPNGVAPSTYPLPRLDWLEQVGWNNGDGQNKRETLQLIFDGDSITQGWKWNGNNTWKERYDKVGFSFGISGDRTQHLLWRLSQGQVNNLKPKLIVLLIGTNNLGNNESVADTIAGIKAVVTDYQKRLPDSVILLLGVFPRGESANDPYRAQIKSVNESISKLDDGRKVVYLDFGDKFLKADGSIDPALMPDFLHPSERGYQIWAESIQPIVDKYVTK